MISVVALTEKVNSLQDDDDIVKRDRGVVDRYRRWVGSMLRKQKLEVLGGGGSGFCAK